MGITGRSSSGLRSLQSRLVLGVWAGCATAGWGCGRGQPTPAQPTPFCPAASCPAASASSDPLSGPLRACLGGEALACAKLADLYERHSAGPKTEGQVWNFWERACDGKVGKACRLLALRLEGGKGVVADPQRAMGYLERACKAGEAEACRGLPRSYVILGDALMAGTKIPKDEARAIELYSRACELDPARCHELATCHQEGTGLPKNRERAAELHARSCEGGGPGCVPLCQLTDPSDLGGGLARDEATLAHWQRLACGASSDPGPVHDCCAAVARRYSEGRGLPKDEAKATYYYERTCAGWTHGCEVPAERYEKGIGVPMDLAKAAELYETACENGMIPNACYRLGAMHESGRGVAKDALKAKYLESKGVGLLSLGCENGAGEACLELADLYTQGRHVPRDARRAAAYREEGRKRMPELLATYEKGCREGVAFYCREAAELLRSGRGVPINRVRATLLFKQACAGGVRLACK